MKALILGGSNSLKKNSWAAGFAESGIELVNKACGSSSGLQYAGLMTHDFSVYDYVIFESLCNDEGDFLNSGMYDDLRLLANIYYEMFATISAQTQLVLLNIALLRTVSNTGYEEQKVTPIAKLRTLLANATGAQVVDVESILKGYALQLGLDHHHYLYEDGPHPAAPFLWQVGLGLGRQLISLTARDRHQLFKKPAVGFADNYQIVSPADLTACGVERLTNRMINEDFFVLREPALDLAAYASFRLIGFYLVCPNNVRYLTFDTEQGPLSMLTGWPGEVARQINKVFVGIPKALRVKALALHEQVAQVDYVHSLIIWRRFAKPVPPAQDDERETGALRMQHLVFRKHELEHDVSSLQDFEFDEAVLGNVLTRQLMDLRSFRAVPYAARTITVFDGASLLFDCQANTCVLLPAQLIACDPRTLVPVLSQQHGPDTLSLHVELDGVRHGLAAGALKLEKTSAGESQTFVCERHGGYFAVKSATHYLRALLMHPYRGVQFDTQVLCDESLFRCE